LIVKSAASDGYTIVKIATHRPKLTGEAYVSTCASRVVDVWRT
jgi:hypothetical protein